MRRNKITVLLLLLLVACLCMSLIACDKTDEDGNFIPSVVTIPAEDDGIVDVDYKVTVLYPDRTPVLGVEVQLFLVDDDEAPFCGATTGSDGVAVLPTSKGLEYFIVINHVPQGYIYEDDDFIAKNETSKTVVISSTSQSNKYDICVVSEGGMPMKNITVSLKDGEEIISSKVTGENGIASIKVATLGEYAIEVVGLPNGYSVVNPDQKTSATAGQVSVTVKSEPIKDKMPDTYRYVMDDIIYDFTLTTSDGKTFTLSEVLKQKKFVMINFWATWCNPCKEEFDDMQTAYERYQEDMAIIAISTSDTNQAVINFKADYSPSLTFDMSTDQNSLYGRFSNYSNGGSIPLSIFVDRYGKISNFIFGGGTEALFRQEFARYTAEDYVQVAYDPSNDEIPIDEPDAPDVNMPASEDIVNKISPVLGGTYSEIGDGKVWPWILGTDGDDDILYASNIERHNNTTATLNYEFKLNEGEFLTFDYFMNTEDIGNADIASVYIDGDWMCDLERVSGGWKTKYLYTPLSSSIDPADSQKNHTLSIYYVKDASDGVYLHGDELVAIKNVRTVTKSELQGDVNVLRPASWNFKEVDGVERYSSFVDVVLNKKDGYYHVGSEDGPYLLANLAASTHYSPESVSALAESGYFELVGIQAQLAFVTDGMSNPPADSYVEYHKGYAWMAKNSDLPNYCYVDERLAIVLDIMVEAFSMNKVQGDFLTKYYHEDAWLELCYYMDNYNGKPLANILQGISNKEAYEAVGGNQPNHVVVDKTLVPRGFIYKYTPDKTGAYKVYSIIPKEYASQQGGYVHITHNGAMIKSEDAIGNFKQYVTFEKGETYYIGVAFDLPGSWGELDFYIDYLGESYDHFTTVTDGTYTYLADNKGDPIYDENGQLTYIISKFDSRLTAQLGEDGYYHQAIDGKMDTGENSYIWISLSEDNALFNATLKELAKGAYTFEGSSSSFFDLTSMGDEDYTDYILALCEEAEQKDAENDITWGMVKADAKLVSILKKALAKIDHASDESWLGFAFYHEHLGEYPAKTSK